MTTPSQTQQLETLFRRQLDAAQELEQILTDENQALITRDYEAVQQLTRLKEEKSAVIDALGKQLNGMLGATGLTLSRASLDKVIAAAPNGKRLGELRQQLETALQSCQDQNLVNGHIIAVNRQSVEAALAILRGQFSPGNLTYGAGGQPVKDQSSNRIIKA